MNDFKVGDMVTYFESDTGYLGDTHTIMKHGVVVNIDNKNFLIIQPVVRRTFVKRKSKEVKRWGYGHIADTDHVVNALKKIIDEYKNNKSIIISEYDSAFHSGFIAGLQEAIIVVEKTLDGSNC